MQYILITAYASRDTSDSKFCTSICTVCNTTDMGGCLLVFCPIRHLLKINVTKLRTFPKKTVVLLYTRRQTDFSEDGHILECFGETP
jgi:hypothetical protein